MRYVAGKGVPPEVGAVLPLGGVGVASARVFEVAMLHLRIEVEFLVHSLIQLNIIKLTHNITAAYSHSKPHRY